MRHQEQDPGLWSQNVSGPTPVAPSSTGTYDGSCGPGISGGPGCSGATGWSGDGDPKEFPGRMQVPIVVKTLRLGPVFVSFLRKLARQPGRFHLRFVHT